MEEDDRRREAAIASAPSLQPNFTSKKGLNPAQISKFQYDRLFILSRRQRTVKKAAEVALRSLTPRRDGKGNPICRDISPPSMECFYHARQLQAVASLIYISLLIWKCNDGKDINLHDSFLRIPNWLASEDNHLSLQCCIIHDAGVEENKETKEATGWRKLKLLSAARVVPLKLLDLTHALSPPVTAPLSHDITSPIYMTARRQAAAKSHVHVLIPNLVTTLQVQANKEICYLFKNAELETICKHG
ncbi:hypothetical protein HAX54_019051 [Datura stramonium]|uniref:Uncharacterized protein n=1 Tax=Datura stramonium TaxID=4076 RepID=A0ABS8S2F2_DATST|nr:hypothetical protein [Datura stramonium]